MKDCIAAWNNECHGWYELGLKSRDAYEVEKKDGLVLAWWAYHGEIMDNYIMVQPDVMNEHNLLAKLADLKVRIQASKSRTVLRMVSENQLSKDLANKLHASGFILDRSDPVMSCDIRKATNVHKGHLKLGQVDSDDYQKVFETIHTVYGGPRELTRFYNPERIVNHYYGSLNGETVVAAAVWPFFQVAGIFSVATLEPFRRRGYASELMKYILYHSAELGFTRAILRTVDQLIPFYKSVGFHEVGRMYSYIKT